MKYPYGFVEVTPNALIREGHNAHSWRSQDGCMSPRFFRNEAERTAELEWYKSVYPGKTWVLFNLTELQGILPGDKYTLKYTADGLLVE